MNEQNFCTECGEFKDCITFDGTTHICLDCIANTPDEDE